MGFVRPSKKGVGAVGEAEGRRQVVASVSSAKLRRARRTAGERSFGQAPGRSFGCLDRKFIQAGAGVTLLCGLQIGPSAVDCFAEVRVEEGVGASADSLLSNSGKFVRAASGRHGVGVVRCITRERAQAHRRGVQALSTPGQAAALRGGLPLQGGGSEWP